MYHECIECFQSEDGELVLDCVYVPVYMKYTHMPPSSLKSTMKLSNHGDGAVLSHLMMATWSSFIC